MLKKKIGENTYFFDSEGIVRTGLDYETRCYYDEYGKKLVGWQKIDSDWYYFDVSTGKMQTGWKQDGDNWYYLSALGRMLKNALVDDGKYYVDENGVMLKDTAINSLGKKYILDSNGMAHEAPEEPYFSDPTWKIKVFLKDKLPITRGQYYKWKIYDNLEMSVVMDYWGDLYLYVRGVVEFISDDVHQTPQSPYNVICRISMVDENGVTHAAEAHGDSDNVVVGEKTYATWKVGTLPLGGGDIKLEFLTAV